MSVLSSQFGIVVDRAIGAPGHGKDIVDEMNATDKRFLQSKMCMIGSPEANDGSKRMAAHSMIEGGVSKSLAEECARLCSDSCFVNGKMKVFGLPKGAHNGLMGMYNLRADPDLGLGKAAVRRIPCACQACIAQLTLEWEVAVAPTKEADLDEIEETQQVVLIRWTSTPYTLQEDVNLLEYDPPRLSFGCSRYLLLL